MPPRRPRHLNSEAARREFEERYGKEHGDLVWRETLGKIAREQAARSPTSVKVEHIPGHVSITSRGRPFRVRPHSAYIEAHPHGRGHHGGRCDGACRRGVKPHRHRRGRGSMGR
ncbi:MAG: hypothetical protein WA691_02880 [Thermoplasmata archaeon]